MRVSKFAAVTSLFTVFAVALVAQSPNDASPSAKVDEAVRLKIHQQKADSAGKLNLPGPDLQNLMLGTWSLKAHATSPDADLGDGAGSELWYAGPGANSMIEELHVNDSKGRPIDAFGPAWWDPEAKGQRYIWCTNDLPGGCIISNEVMCWDGDNFVYTEDDRQKVRDQEVFSEIKPDSFTQTISRGPAGSRLIPTWIAQATKLPAEAQRMSFPAPPIGKASNQSRQDMKKLIDAFAGHWSIHLTLAPGKESPNGGSGAGEETWTAGPGGNSLIEQYHSIGTEGDLSGLGVFWPSAKDQSFQILWCDNSSSPGCRQLKNDAEWKNEQLSISDEQLVDGKKHMFRETFAFDTPRSFTQTLSEGEVGVVVQLFLTIRATRK